MKQTKYHTGKYSCLDCCIEYEVFHDEQLKCDRCKGRLVKGSLDEFESDWEDSDDNQ